jgi:hypothetical protein
MKVPGLFSRELFVILISSCLLFLIFAPPAHAQSFSYSNFSSTAGLQLNGNAAQSGSVLRLTPGSPDQNGSAFYMTQLPLKTGFTSTFTFQFSGEGGSGGHADGIAFMIQGVGTTAMGSLGGAIGYGDDDGNSDPALGIPHSVAIELDTYQNGWDPNNNHIAVMSCGAANNSQHHGAGGCASGADPTIGINSTFSTNLTDGAPHTVIVTYQPPCDGCQNLTVQLDGTQVLAVTFDLATLGLDANDDAYAGFTASTGGGYENQDILSWNFGVTVVQTFNTNTPTTANFSTAGGENQQTLDLSTATGGLTCKDAQGNTITCPTTTLVTTNNTLSATTTWPQYVNGTPWATSVCAARPANGGAGDLCSLFVNACFGGSVTQAQADDYFCPSATPDTNGTSTITLSDTWDPLNPKPTIAPGTTVSLIDFVPSTPGETWTASTGSENPNAVCTNVTTPFQCDISDTLTVVYGDQTTTRGSKPKKGWIVTVFKVPMLTTQWSILTGLPGNTACPTPTTNLNNNPASSSAWFNASCPVQYQVNEANPQNPTNNYVAAPPASITYGQYPATVPASHDATNTNGTLMNPWTVGPGSISTFLQSIGGSGGDGTYTFHWSAVDNVGISEKSVQLDPNTADTCVNPVPNGTPATFNGPCYNTNLFTTTINVDSTAPTISSAGFTPSGSPVGTFGVGEVAYPSYTCADNLSGLQNCGGIPVSCPLTVGPETLTSTTPLTTTKAGSFSFPVTAIDCAGNVSNPATIINYTVLPPADVAIYELETTDHPKHGTNFTYIAWAFDLNKQNAYSVNFSIQVLLPSGTLAPGGTIKGIVADCGLLTGCSAPPVTGSNCTVASSPSGANTLYTISCNVGTLQSVFTLRGTVAAVTIPIASTATGNQFGIVATVNSSGDPNLKNNTTTDTITVK